MKIEIRMLFEWLPEENSDQRKYTERVLFISRDSQKIVVIDISDTKALPVLRERDEIESAYNVGDLRIIKYDKFADLDLQRDDIPPKYTAKRDRAWKAVESILSKAGDRIYESKSRWKSLLEVEKETGVIPKYLYGYLRRYWQSGFRKNSLLPRYKKCGNKGIKKNNSLNSKLGRHSDLSKAIGKNFGIAITEHDRKLFEKGIRKFYLTREKVSLIEAYRRTIDEYYNIDIKIENGVKIPILPPAEELPTYRQFYYWYVNYFKDLETEKIARLGENKFNLLHRDLFNDSTSLSFGPGSIFMIDATIGDVYLVSSFDRNRIIGRPVIYLIVDVFSRLIVGFSVSLEGPSWAGAMLALDNMITDKIEFCAQFERPIEKEVWDCHHLPVAIFADRGEFEGYNATVLTDVLGIRIHNTSPYRGDLKAIVERDFGIAKEKFIQYIPGVVKERERGEKDHRLDGTLTLNEFRALMINHILHYNAKHKLSWYRPDEFLVADNVPLKPYSLWNWGIKNRSGILRTTSQEEFRFALLPRKQATINRMGVHFQNDIYYLPPASVKNRGKNSRVKIAYDPRSLDFIYLIAEDKKIFKCPLTPASKLYLGRDYQEVEEFFAFQNKQDELDRTDQNQSGAQYRAYNKHIIDKAKAEKARQLSNDTSDASRLKGIRQNRSDEREHERNVNRWSSEEEYKLLPGQELLLEDEYIPVPDYFDVIDPILEEGGQQ